MGFWTKSTGETANVDVNQEGVETGKIIRIPNNTKVLAVIKSIESLLVREGKEADALDGTTLGYKIEWEVIEKGEYNGGIQRQGVKVFAAKERSRDEALDLLFFMDNLFADGRFAAAGDEPDMAELEAAFQGKPAIILVRGMESENPETGEKSYVNWVGGVFRYKEPAKAHKTVNAAVEAAKQTIQQQAETTAQKKAREAREAVAAAEAEAAAEEAAAAAQGAGDGDGYGHVSSDIDDDIPY